MIDDDWATKNAPDAISAGHAAKVLTGLRGMTLSHQHYLMTADSSTSREHAARIVDACHTRKCLWARFERWFFS